MRAFHVNGLAAFWAHYNMLNVYDPLAKESPRQESPLTGGLADKLRGLSAALDVARRSAPCVLHVAELDDELSPDGGNFADVDGRKEEEQRILEAIREGCGATDMLLLCSTYPSKGTDAMSFRRRKQDHFLSAATAPRVIVILSTTDSLSSGPISTSLIQTAVPIAKPDLLFARKLWNDDATFDIVKAHLIGMTARDISFAKDLFSRQWKANSSSPQPLDVLQSVLPTVEAARSLAQSGQSNGKTSPLASASLPNVRWEDIGGLESIRREIMDTVELPLRYPKLFEGSKRSGILLFGPPGTFNSRIWSPLCLFVCLTARRTMAKR